jgi:hypothetical protein
MGCGSGSRKPGASTADHRQVEIVSLIGMHAAKIVEKTVSESMNQ